MSKYCEPLLQLLPNLPLCEYFQCKEPQRYIVYTCHGAYDGKYCVKHGKEMFAYWVDCKNRYEAAKRVEQSTLKITTY